MFDQLSMAGLVPVIKIEDAADAVPLCSALERGGLPVAEITFRTPAAEESIRRVHAALPGVLLGAGTVLTRDQASRAVDAGAGYIVSPGINPDVVRHCQDLGVPVLPGCITPSEIETALSLGLDMVKFFPAESAGGLHMIRALAAPYGQLKFVPTGGIGPKNLLEYLAFPKIAACGGSFMVPEDALARKDFQAIEALTRQAVDLMLGLELQKVALPGPAGADALESGHTLGRMLGWPVCEGEDAVFVGKGFELAKTGCAGHIGVGTHSLPRALWHMRRRGFAVKPGSEVFQNGKMVSADLQQTAAGFGLRLYQK